MKQVHEFTFNKNFLCAYASLLARVSLGAHIMLHNVLMLRQV